MNNSEFKSAKLRLEMSGIGTKNKVVLNFNNLIEAPTSETLTVFASAIEALTAGSIEAKQCIVTSQLD